MVKLQLTASLVYSVYEVQALIVSISQLPACGPYYNLVPRPRYINTQYHNATFYFFLHCARVIKSVCFLPSSCASFIEN